MQMLIYLFALYANGKERYGDFLPSGIFYMSAKTEKLDLPRDATQEQIDNKRLFSKENKYSGMVVDDITAIEGMEKDLKGLFVPFKRENDGTLSGKIIPLEQVQDPVFSEKMLGDGVAVDPEDNTVYAPFDGTLINLNPNLHAVVFSDGKLELLVHIGLETVSLKGKGFTAHAKQGDTVRKGQKIITFDKDFISQHAPCAWVMCVLTAPADTPVTPRTGRVAHGECLFYTGDAPAEVSVPASPAQTQAEVSVSVTICNPHGLHARPAGQLAQAAKKFPFPITLRKADKTADAKSVVSVLGLALRAGEEAVLSAPAHEPSAQAALGELAGFIAGGLGEDLSAPAAAPAPAEVSAPAVPAQTGGALQGLTACGGLAEGKTFFFKHAEISFTENAQNPQEEKGVTPEGAMDGRQFPADLHRVPHHLADPFIRLPLRKARLAEVPVSVDDMRIQLLLRLPPIRRILDAPHRLPQPGHAPVGVHPLTSYTL